MSTEQPTITATLAAYTAVADRHAEGDRLHAAAYAAAAPEPEAPASAYGVESGPRDE